MKNNYNDVKVAAQPWFIAVAGLLILFNVSLAAESLGSTPRVARKDGFFGIHFDLHPNKSDTALGRDVTEENIRAFLRRVRPDFVQYDCVGVPGYSGYPTKIGWPAPGMVKDSLAIWRKVTREERVALLIHYCVLWNEAAVEHHPDWAAVNAKGQPNKQLLSIFSPFAEQLLIPQLKEAATLYDLDGAWLDADAWVAALDYSPAALAEWKRQTGLSTAPKSRPESGWAEWKMFHRREFEKYLRRYVDAIHAHSPKFQIACNWMYSLHHGVWPVGSSQVDYLSGDYSQHNSTDEARAEARYFASNRKPWDLLAWGFNKHGLKSVTQLQQEAAATIMQGGGWGIYYVPTRSGQISDAITATAGEVADFCRARQAVSFHSTTVPQVALLQSAETYWDRADNGAFSQADCVNETKGALQALLELHYSVDILAEHQLGPRLREFPVVVIPDASRLAEDFRRALLDYVDAGGNLVLLGEKCARLFEPALGVKLEGAPNQGGVLVSGDQSVSWTDGWQKVTPAGAKVIGQRRVTTETHVGEEPAATVVTRGRGRIAAVYGPVAARFLETRPVAIRELLGAVMRETFPQPAVEVDAPATVDLALRRTRDGRLSVHFLNLAKVQRGEQEFPALDPFPAVGPFAVRLRTPRKPAAVRWEPDGRNVEWSWRDGVLTVVVPRLEIHGVVVIKGA